ncbi:unnamed protein product [Symbiodinium sp. KB8]|nr:unnamed protein product [Symbiodinium sp. KB8]
MAAGPRLGNGKGLGQRLRAADPGELPGNASLLEQNLQLRLQVQALHLELSASLEREAELLSILREESRPAPASDCCSEAEEAEEEWWGSNFMLPPPALETSENLLLQGYSLLHDKYHPPR